MGQKQIGITAISKGQTWKTGLFAVFYLSLLMALIFLPGGTLLDRLRWLDSGICAQMPTHSFFPGGERLPLCARNTGIYLGFIVTLIILYITGRGRAQHFPPRAILILLVGGILLLAIDGLNSFALDLGLPHLYKPHNALRLATGLATGLALALLALPMLNRLCWRTENQQPSLASWKGLLPLLGVLVIYFFAITSQSVLVLYPIALLSTLGLITTVSSLNMIFVVLLSKHEESFQHYRELLPFFSLALLFALGELLLLAQIKLLLLRTLGLP